MDYILQISENLRDLRRLSTEWVKYWIVKDYQQYHISTKLVIQIINDKIWRIYQRYGIFKD